MGLPPLPPGWAEFISPSGLPYYYNAITKESTYQRPMPNFAMAAQIHAQQAAVKKKEKPLVKTPIPGTEWIRVITTEGNTFYTHKEKKQSVWTVPTEIKDAVKQLEMQEAEKKAEEHREKQRRAEEEVAMADAERLAEVERIKDEVESMVKKRASEDVPMDEVLVAKKPRIEDVNDGEEDDEDESEEEDWQREAAVQLAAEAEAELQRQQEEKQAEEEERKREEEAQKQINMPARVDISIEEGKALFKTLLREKDINPLLPWDTSLPLFVTDPRYVLLPNVNARKEAFDEYCRDRARELKEQKVREQKEAANPKEAFERLLKEEVKSTRTSWTDWRRQWKKDRRFYNWGRDDREREKRFRDYLKELGEKKRVEAQKAETNFFALLKESGLATPGAVWKEVKQNIHKDPRYDAVGSSSLREELFNTFLKARGAEKLAQSIPAPSNEAMKEIDEMIDGIDQETKRKEKKERAVREREQKVKADLTRVEADIGRSRMGADREEGEREYRTMLIDAIRDPQMSWDNAVEQLKVDPRFVRSPLAINQQIRLYQAHVDQLRAKHLKSLHTLFESYAPSLVTRFSELPLSSLMSSLPVTKLGLRERGLEEEFDRWQRERNHDARVAFDEMLGENSFVEFWGRLNKMTEEKVSQGVKFEDEEDEEADGEGGGGRADIKTLAKSIDLKEITKVVKNDKRYIVFDHVPEQREAWIRDYLSRLHAPGLSVHIAARE
ncbi:hypothetical protein PUNSTDRAFT_85044 [Punctularia strigosozonata HHB-11173 SS5]|uniref:uncharacterized protein n=1 Tax=Punctularia strigosozonata (strain HHB-11173) TaxID=741275 RepID=UPI0004417527|nr:uncharacterized protein PUNSTDRAFT_85044 [Punctularia strigosozonata HHB-11173 SS5]EIN10749.1 hypothetical protein PUNSTDRAFT_85044 [Punctularia strigosozonata HHB-11173 SS5]